MMKKVLVRAIRYTGLPFMVRKLIQSNKVTIIYYHDIKVQSFDEHLSFLTSRYNIISLQSYLSGNTASIKNRLIITFDDGHIRNYTLLPVLKKFNVPVTIFLTSGIVGTKRHFWFLIKDLDPETKARCKELPDEERLKLLASRFRHEDTREYEIPEALANEHLLEMSGHVDFQSHTRTHPCLPKCTDKKAEEEIAGSKADLESILNKNVNCLAFPNGNYCERDVNICLKAGYKGMLTAEFGFNKEIEHGPFLKRISTNDTGDINELALRVTGIWRILKSVLKKD